MLYPAMKIITKSILILLVCLCTFKVYAQTQYVKKFQAMACSLAHKYGIPASVILSVAIVESGAGTSKHVKLLNNHFGIVGKNTLAKRHPTARSRYKEYPNAAASYEDFCKLISRKKFYPSLKGSTDYKKWIMKISASGYSAKPQVWQNRVESTIAKYHLHKYDKM